MTDAVLDRARPRLAQQRDRLTAPRAVRAPACGMEADAYAPREQRGGRHPDLARRRHGAIDAVGLLLAELADESGSPVPDRSLPLPRGADQGLAPR